jgi:hypothetical protein
MLRVDAFDIGDPEKNVGREATVLNGGSKIRIVSDVEEGPAGADTSIDRRVSPDHCCLNPRVCSK